MKKKDTEMVKADPEEALLPFATKEKKFALSTPKTAMPEEVESPYKLNLEEMVIHLGADVNKVTNQYYSNKPMM